MAHGPRTPMPTAWRANWAKAALKGPRSLRVGVLLGAAEKESDRPFKAGARAGDAG